MLDPLIFKDSIIPNALSSINLNEENAVNLLAGTAAVESDLGKFIIQKNNGPARGIFQMEEDTYNDIWENFLKYRKGLSSLILKGFKNKERPDYIQITNNMILSIHMARVHYLRNREPIPEKNDIEGLALYWKRNYNTIKGKGKVEDFIYKYNKYFKT